MTKLPWCGSACPDSYALHQGFGIFVNTAVVKNPHVFIPPLHVANMLHFWKCSPDAYRIVQKHTRGQKNQTA